MGFFPFLASKALLSGTQKVGNFHPLSIIRNLSLITLAYHHKVILPKGFFLSLTVEKSDFLMSEHMSITFYIHSHGFIKIDDIFFSVYLLIALPDFRLAHAQ